MTVMGEIADPEHPDLEGRIARQFDAASTPGEVKAGEGPLSLQHDRLAPGDGHGTHIAETIAANADGKGVQGVASGATLDFYDIGAYGTALADVSENENLERILGGFATALSDVMRRGESKITTGSFNLEGPALISLAPGSLSMADVVEIADAGGIDKALAHPALAGLSPEDQARLKRAVDVNGGDMSIVAMALLSGTPVWNEVAEAVTAYQQAGGVYLVAESNNDFGSDTSALNALPELAPEVDRDMWLSVVMVVPEGLTEESTDAEIEAAMGGAYATPLNDCGELAKDYCITTPSYNVLSTMTERVAEPGLPLLMDGGRSYQVFSGHSMGAPMVAAALALMEEFNQREGKVLSMRELVAILKESAKRDFPGYSPVQHGVGMLDVGTALAALAAR